jgi:DNA-binding FadR family transcriptional regulator
MIVESAHSPALSSVYAAVSKLLQKSHMERRQMIANVPDVDAYLVGHHEAIIQAILRKNAIEADTLLTEHFEIGANLREDAIHADKQQRFTTRVS